MSQKDNYLPGNCTWTVLGKEQADEVIEQFDLSPKESPIDDNDNCEIKICDNVSINGKPIYQFSCNPTDFYALHKKRTNILMTIDQREILQQLNPYGPNYDPELHKELLEKIEIKGPTSPKTVTEIYSPTKGGKRIFKRKTRKLCRIKKSCKNKKSCRNRKK